MVTCCKSFLVLFAFDLRLRLRVGNSPYDVERYTQCPLSLRGVDVTIHTYVLVSLPKTSFGCKFLLPFSSV